MLFAKKADLFELDLTGVNIEEALRSALGHTIVLAPEQRHIKRGRSGNQVVGDRWIADLLSETRMYYEETGRALAIPDFRLTMNEQILWYANSIVSMSVSSSDFQFQLFETETDRIEQRRPVFALVNSWANRGRAEQDRLERLLRRLRLESPFRHGAILRWLEVLIQLEWIHPRVFASVRTAASRALRPRYFPCPNGLNLVSRLAEAGWPMYGKEYLVICALADTYAEHREIVPLEVHELLPIVSAAKANVQIGIAVTEDEINQAIWNLVNGKEERAPILELVERKFLIPRENVVPRS